MTLWIRFRISSVLTLPLQTSIRPTSTASRSPLRYSLFLAFYAFICISAYFNEQCFLNSNCKKVHSMPRFCLDLLQHSPRSPSCIEGKGHNGRVGKRWEGRWKSLNPHCKNKHMPATSPKLFCRGCMTNLFSLMSGK